MSVQVQVIEINRQKMTVTIEAFNGSQRIFKSSMPYKTETRAHIESLLKKELKAFERPSYGGMNITFMCRIGGLS
ncbi:MAG: hypothetical protein LBV35_02370 [Acinetobacter sp.]|jgi:predicted thioesterase|uniref:hypothetical protein n=1 Tax=Acinetobacter sp. TaxID=472 RepID=UPI0028452D91|nr:hypothetical protein [Acinetobacter sp.]MDR3027284.1 hypothetical protein [Acinetobacter sp.]